MAADGTSIKNDIDNDLASKGYRGVRIANVISALKNVVDWVTTTINGNLTTWYKVGTTTPAGANSDNVYRTGKVIIGRATDDGDGATLLVDGFVKTRSGVRALTGLTTSTAMANTTIGSGFALQVQGGGTSVPAYMEFHVPGVLIHQFGVDTDGVFKVRPWSSSASYPIVIDRQTASFSLANTIANRKLVLFDANNNDHQFIGVGVNSGMMRYQIDATTNSHVFYAGATPVTSNELMRIQGNGLVDVAGGGRFKSVTIPASGAGLEVQYGAIPNAASILAYDRTANAYRTILMDGDTVAINSGNATNGRVGVGTASATSTLHVKGATGHQQFRLETSYTPSSSADANGAVGQIAWDVNFFYVKTAAGWKRTALVTF